MGNRPWSWNALRAVAAMLVACMCTVAQTQTPPTDAAEQAKLRQRLIEAMPIAEAAADGEVITVVDGATGEPVANADVVVMSYPRDREARLQLEKNFREIGETAKDVETMQWTILTRFGTRHRTDADGAVRMATREGHDAFAMAFADGRTGQGSVGTIKIWSTAIVTVEVIDAHGRPAVGVPVGLHEVGDRFGAQSAPTDAQGVARLALNNRSRERQMRMVARAEIAHEHAVEAEFDSAAPPEAPLRLQLPAGGKVRFVLYGPDEKPLRELQRATLSLAGEDRGRTQRIAAPPTRLDADGAHFDHVATGRDLVINAFLQDTQSPLTFRGKGPTRADELVVIEGRTNIAEPVITFRVLGPDGTPLAKTSVAKVMRSAHGHDYGTIETDAEGRLRVKIPKDSQQLYVLHREDVELTAGLGSLCIDVDALPGGLQDLGDLRLAPEPVCARARVLDGDGKPVPGALVMARLSILGGNGGGSRSGSFDPFQHRVRTDAEGRFELRELRPLGDSLDVTVQHDKLVAPPGTLKVTLDGVARDLGLTMCGSLHGTLEPGLDGLSPNLHLVSRAAQQAYGLQLRDEAFGNQQLPAGEYDLILDKDSGARIDGIVVPAGGETTDERLSPVRWKEHLQVVQVDVTDDAGKPAENVLVWAMMQRAGGSGHRTDKAGRARMLVARANITIAVEHAGFAIVDGVPAQAAVAIRLQRLAPVEVRVSGLPDLPKGLSAALTATAERPAQGATVRRGGHQQEQVRNGSATLQPDRAGKWKVSLSVRTDDRLALDRGTRQAVQRALRIDLPTAEFEAGGAAQEPLRIEIGDDTRELLAERFAEVKELLDAAEKAKADAGGR